MASTQFRLNHGGMAALLKSSEVRAALQGPAQRILDAAQANAPRDTGEYSNSLRIEQDTTDRAVVRVRADIWYAHIIEARDGVLGKALNAG